MTADLDLLVDAAREGGKIALEQRARGLRIEAKPGGSPVTNGDLAVDAFLTDRLLRTRPDYGWLSEERTDDVERLSRRRLFVVDPIDGTVAYMKNRPWWTVALAVIEDGEPVAAVVHAPALDETFTAVRGQGARLNGRPIQASDVERLEDASMLADAALLERPIWEEPWPAMRLERRNSIAYRGAQVGLGCRGRRPDRLGGWGRRLGPRRTAAPVQPGRSATGLAGLLRAGPAPLDHPALSAYRPDRSERRDPMTDHDHDDDKQLLHIVIGGELRHLSETTFRDLSKIDFVGAYPNYAEARKAWKAKAQSTVDNAHMRYFILHAHKLIDPRGEGE